MVRTSVSMPACRARSSEASARFEMTTAIVRVEEPFLIASTMPGGSIRGPK